MSQSLWVLVPESGDQKKGSASPIRPESGLSSFFMKLKYVNFGMLTYGISLRGIGLAFRGARGAQWSYGRGVVAGAVCFPEEEGVLVRPC